MCFLSTTFPNAAAHPPPPPILFDQSLTNWAKDDKLLGLIRTFVPSNPVGLGTA